MNIEADGLADLIAEYMTGYTQDITDGVKKGIDVVSKECNEEIKNHITFKQHPGNKYVKAFRIKSIFEDRFNKRNVWHVTNGQYRLTHLLENGHALNQGGRAEAYPHIKYGEELAKKRMEELAKEAIENAGH